MLVLTFAIVVSITFYSLSYIGSYSAEYDAIEKSFRTVESNISILNYFLITTVSCIIALIITLFDRMLYQSDWFFQLPISKINTIGIYDIILFFIRKTSRVLIRIAISIAVAYSLSIFLELRVLESQIIKNNQNLYLLRNEKVFSDIQAESARLSERIDGVSSEVASLRQKSIEESQRGAEIDPGLALKLRALESELSGIDSAHDSNYVVLKARLDDELRPLLDRAAEIAPLLRQATANVSRYADFVNAEKEGINPEGLPGVSEQAGCEARCRYWEAKLEQARADEALLRSEIAENEKAIDAKKKAFATAVQLSDASSAKRKGTLQSQRDEILARVETESSGMEEQHRRRVHETTERLAAKEAEFAALQGSFFTDLRTFEQRRQAAPDYVPFTDGPLERLTALFDLKNNGEHGPTITWFSWWVKGFVIFLEVAPVLSKMFFAPPSVYGFRIRSIVAAGQIEQIDIANNRATASREEYETSAAKLDNIVWERQARARARKAFEDGEDELFGTKKRAP